MSVDATSVDSVGGEAASTGRRRGPWPGVLVRVGVALVAGALLVAASFMPWIGVVLPAGTPGETSGWDLGSITFVTDLQSFDRDAVEGATFTGVEDLAQALTAGGLACVVVPDPVGVPAGAPFVARAACGPARPPSDRTPEQVFAASTPKFTVSATPEDNELVADRFLTGVERANAGPGLRGYGLVLVGPNWSMSSREDSVLVDAQAVIGGTLVSTKVETNRFFVPDLFERGFFTGVTTVLLGVTTALVGVIFLVGALIASRRTRSLSTVPAVLALLGVAGLAGVVVVNWFSWITRGDGYDDVGLEPGFSVVTVGAVLGVAALAAIVTYPRTPFGTDDQKSEPAVVASPEPSAPDHATPRRITD